MPFHKLIGYDPDGGRPLTPGERRMAAMLFGTALDPAPVRIHRAKWWPFQPRDIVMAPDGHVWIHPACWVWRDDFSIATGPLSALLAHELTHVWQHQRGICLPLRRLPFARYDYRLTEGRPLEDYGLEQQAMIVQHGWSRINAGLSLGPYRQLLPATRLDAAATSRHMAPEETL